MLMAICNKHRIRNPQRTYGFLATADPVQREISSDKFSREPPIIPEILPLFPLLSASFRNLPGISRFSGFFRLFPCFSAYLQTGLNRTFGHFLRF